MKKKDKKFSDHFKNNKKANLIILAISVIFSHKFLKIITSQFNNKKYFDAKFDSKINFIRV